MSRHARSSESRRRPRAHLFGSVAVAAVLCAGALAAPAAAAVRVRSLVVAAAAHVQRGTGAMRCPSTDARSCKFPTPGNDAIVSVQVPVSFTTVRSVDIVATFAGDCLNVGEQFLVLSGVVASVSRGSSCRVSYHLSVKNENAQSDLDVFKKRGPAKFDAWFAPGSGNLRAVSVSISGAAPLAARGSGGRS